MKSNCSIHNRNSWMRKMKISMLKKGIQLRKLRTAIGFKSISTILSMKFVKIKIQKELSQRTQTLCSNNQLKWWILEDLPTTRFRHLFSHSMEKRHSKKRWKLVHVLSKGLDWITKTTRLTMKTKMFCYRMNRIINSRSSQQFRLRMRKSLLNSKPKSITMTQNYWKLSKIN